MQIVNLRSGQNVNKQKASAGQKFKGFSNPQTLSEDKYCSGSRPQIAFKGYEFPEKSTSGRDLKLSERKKIVSENSNLFKNVKKIKIEKIYPDEKYNNGYSSKIINVNIGSDSYNVHILANNDGELNRLAAFKNKKPDGESESFFYNNESLESRFIGTSKEGKRWDAMFKNKEMKKFVTSLLKKVGEEYIPDLTKNDVSKKK